MQIHPDPLKVLCSISLYFFVFVSIDFLVNEPGNTAIVIHTLNFAQVKSMDDNCGEWVECMGVVSRRWVWLVGVGGIYGCGCKEVYRFPHTTYPYSSCIYMYFFAAATLLFCSFFKCFSFLFQYFLKLHFRY